jgi:hypothetical protein
MKSLLTALVTSFSLIASGGLARAASVVSPALPNRDHTVSVSGPPRPLAGFFHFPVYMHALMGPPLIVPDGSSIVYLQPQSEGACIGSAELCPSAPEIQMFPPGGDQGRFDKPIWTYTLKPPLEASQLVWWDGAITFGESVNDEGGTPQSLRIVRLSLSGHLLSTVTLPLPQAFAEYENGVTGIAVTPEANGLLVYQDVSTSGGAPTAQVLELLEPDGSVRWERTITGGAVWNGASVIVEENEPGSLVYTLSEASGRTLWRETLAGQLLWGAADGTLLFLPLGAGNSPVVPFAITARSVSTGAALWRRTVRYAWFHGMVASGSGFVMCENEAAAHPAIHNRSTCTRYADQTGEPQRSIVVPNASVGSIVIPLAASPIYLLVQVYKAPFKPPAGEPPSWCDGLVYTCTPAATFTEAFAWSGKGTTTVHSGVPANEPDEDLTYNFGGQTAMTVLTPSSVWVWGHAPTPPGH